MADALAEGSAQSAHDRARRWSALGAVCLGVLMVVLDTTVVSVALPFIRRSLGFSDTSLVWVTNVYMLTFGSTLLLAGRLGDVFGHRRMFLLGTLLFTVTSLACGCASSCGVLIVARAVQGVAGAAVVAVALALIVNLFEDGALRARANGVYGFVCAAGGSIGLLLGGLITSTLGWHWIFLINVPFGIAVLALCARLLPPSPVARRARRLDVHGAVAVTASLVLANYAIVSAHDRGWDSLPTIGLFAASATLFSVFLSIEMRARDPLVPLRIFRHRLIAAANAIGLLAAAGISPWIYFAALYLQQVLGYAPLRISSAFLPVNVIVALSSLGLSGWVVSRFGIRAPLAIGLFLCATGIAILARVPVDGTLVADILPSMILIGAGAGITFNPLFLASTSGVSSDDSGLASGIATTVRLFGGALGLAILASVAATRTRALLDSGADSATAITGGYRLALLIGAAATATAALLALMLLRPAASRAPIGTCDPAVRERKVGTALQGRSLRRE